SERKCGKEPRPIAQIKHKAAGDKNDANQGQDNTACLLKSARKDEFWFGRHWDVAWFQICPEFGSRLGFNGLSGLLGEGKRRRSFLLRYAGQIGELGCVQNSQVAIAEKSFFDKYLDHLIRHTRNLPEPMLRPVDGFVQLCRRHNLDVPADEL